MGVNPRKILKEIILNLSGRAYWSYEKDKASENAI